MRFVPAQANFSVILDGVENKKVKTEGTGQNFLINIFGFIHGVSKREKDR